MITGVGVGLRPSHYSYIETEYPDVPWFEVLSDNYLFEGGSSLFHLEKIREHYPITLHGVGLSLGSTDPLNFSYLKKLKSLIERVQPFLVSDHLSWTSFSGQYFHELLPLPYTEEAVSHTARRIRDVQDFLGRQMMIENVSSYLRFNHSTLTEWEFLQAVADEADCLILLDINNIYVSAKNNAFDPRDYLSYLSQERIGQFHLAGFEDKKTHLLDTHSAPVYPPVWELFKTALKKFGCVPTAIEWDNHVPDFPRLKEEADIAKKIILSIDYSREKPLPHKNGDRNKIVSSESLFNTQKEFIVSLHTRKKETRVYQDSITGSLQKTMQSIYPVVAKLVGDDFFIAMIQPYIEKTRSFSPDLTEYGETFPAFIADFKPADSLPYLADTARLEWALHRVFNAKDSSTLDLEKLTARFNENGEELIFLLGDRSALISSPYPLRQIWENNQKDAPNQEKIILSDKKNISYFFVRRKKLELKIEELTSDEWTLLKLIQSGATLGEISDKADLTLIPTMIEREWIVEFQ